MNTIKTEELIEQLRQLQGRFVEASISDGQINATHILRFGGRKIFDIGVDSRESTWKPDEFVALYPSVFWKVEQVV